MKIQHVKYRAILAKRNEIHFLKRVVNRSFSTLLLFWMERICVLRVTAAQCCPGCMAALLVRGVLETKQVPFEAFGKLT